MILTVFVVQLKAFDFLVEKEFGAGNRGVIPGESWVRKYQISVTITLAFLSAPIAYGAKWQISTEVRGGQSWEFEPNQGDFDIPLRNSSWNCSADKIRKFGSGKHRSEVRRIRCSSGDKSVSSLIYCSKGQPSNSILLNLGGAEDWEAKITLECTW